MNKEELLQFCRYYKGEEDCAFDDKENGKQLLWDYERVWFEMSSNRTEENISYFDTMITEYLSCGLKDFNFTDNTPITLKALLFNRFCHWGSGSMLECVENFKKWYLKCYIQGDEVYYT